VARRTNGRAVLGRRCAKEPPTWVALVLLGVLVSCSPRPATRPAALPAGDALGPGSTVLVLRPSIRFESMEREVALADGAREEVAFAGSLRDAARLAAASAGAVVLECDSPDAANVAALCADLSPHVRLLSRGVVRPESAQLLARGDLGAPAISILATSCLGRVGPAGYYNSQTGQLHAASRSTVLSAALIGADGHLKWKNDVLLRAVPEATDANYLEALTLLFSAAPRP
jgi:hypothetical protein